MHTLAFPQHESSLIIINCRDVVTGHSANILRNSTQIIYYSSSLLTYRNRQADGSDKKYNKRNNNNNDLNLSKQQVQINSFTFFNSSVIYFQTTTYLKPLLFGPFHSQYNTPNKDSAWNFVWESTVHKQNRHRNKFIRTIKTLCKQYHHRLVYSINVCCSAVLVWVKKTICFSGMPVRFIGFAEETRVQRH